MGYGWAMTLAAHRLRRERQEVTERTEYKERGAGSGTIFSAYDDA